MTPGGTLICPDHLIFDSAGVRAQLLNAFADCSDNSQMRAATVRVLRDAQKAGRSAIADAFAARRN